MPIEIREVIIKAQLEKQEDHSAKEKQVLGKNAMERIKEEVLKACLERLEDKLSQRLFER